MVATKPVKCLSKVGKILSPDWYTIRDSKTVWGGMSGLSVIESAYAEEVLRVVRKGRKRTSHSSGK